MSVVRFLWQRLTGKGQGCSAVVAADMRRLRKAADLHLLETHTANRHYLDSIDAERATASALDDLVNTMTARR